MRVWGSSQALLEALSGTGNKPIAARQEALRCAQGYYGLKGLAARSHTLTYAWHNVAFVQALDAYSLFMESGACWLSDGSS